MRRQRRTKIVATLGPASSDHAMIERLFLAGADVFRINMSHTTHDAMRAYIKAIRAIEDTHSRPIGILVDLQGPKLRLATFANGGETLAKHASFTIDADPTAGNAQRVHLPHPEVLAALEPGHRLLIDDGKRPRVGPQGREPARHHGCVRRPHPQGSLRSRGRAQ